MKTKNKLDELNDILERKLRNEKCLRIAAEESLMDLQVVYQSKVYSIVHRTRFITINSFWETWKSEHNALLVKLAEFEEEKNILKNLLDDLRSVFILILASLS